MKRLAKLTGLFAVLLTTGCGSNSTAPSTDLQGATPRTSGDLSMDASESTWLAIGSFDEVENDVEPPCLRGAGFYCQKQDGSNPNMTAEQFQMYATQAAAILSDVPGLNTTNGVATAVCDTGHQLLRHLATLALNLAAGLVDLTTPHMDPDYPTVGDVLARGIEIAGGTVEVSRTERREVHEMLERINENISIETDSQCEVEDEEEDDGEEGGEDNNGEDDNGSPTPDSCGWEDPKNSNKILICHKGKNTLSISRSSWPDHQAHGDTCGPCGIS